MKRRCWWKVALGFLACTGRTEENSIQIRIILDPENAQRSYGERVSEQPGRYVFPVGLGRNGVTAEGESFVAGSSLLGKFKVNAILTKEQFSMSADLVEKSGKSSAWLEEHLFANMSSIDFDGDGKGGEYGGGFISLEPIDSSAEQPFHFGEYRGVFRWYSYAIHGTQNPDRVGKCSTGGCINVGEDHLSWLVTTLRLGDQVEIVSR